MSFIKIKRGIIFLLALSIFLVIHSTLAFAVAPDHTVQLHAHSTYSKACIAGFCELGRWNPNIPNDAQIINKIKTYMNDPGELIKDCDAPTIPPEFRPPSEGGTGTIADKKAFEKACAILTWEFWTIEIEAANKQILVFGLLEPKDNCKRAAESELTDLAITDYNVIIDQESLNNEKENVILNQKELNKMGIL